MKLASWILTLWLLLFVLAGGVVLTTGAEEVLTTVWVLLVTVSFFLPILTVWDGTTKVPARVVAGVVWLVLVVASVLMFAGSHTLKLDGRVLTPFDIVPYLWVVGTPIVYFLSAYFQLLRIR
jgi:hypothetical protein